MGKQPHEVELITLQRDIAEKTIKLSRRKLTKVIFKSVLFGAIGGGAINLGAANALIEMSSKNVSKKDLAIDASTIVLGAVSAAFTFRQGVRDLSKGIEVYRRAANRLEQIGNYQASNTTRNS